VAPPVVQRDAHRSHEPWCELVAGRSFTRTGLATVKAGLHGAEPDEDSAFLAASAACTRGVRAGAMPRGDAGSAWLLRTAVGQGTGWVPFPGQHIGESSVVVLTQRAPPTSAQPAWGPPASPPPGWHRAAAPAAAPKPAAAPRRLLGLPVIASSSPRGGGLREVGGVESSGRLGWDQERLRDGSHTAGLWSGGLRRSAMRCSGRTRTIPRKGSTPRSRVRLGGLPDALHHRHIARPRPPPAPPTEHRPPLLLRPPAFDGLASLGYNGRHGTPDRRARSTNA